MLTANDHHIVGETFPIPEASENVPEFPLGAIPDNSVSDLSGSNDPQTFPAQRIG